MDSEFLQQFMQRIHADDALFDNFLSAARGGANQAFMATKNETLIVDDTWVYTIDGVLFSIEKVARDPRKFIAEQESIVDVERARKTNAKTVRHLASHSGNVRNIKDDGEVVPKKLLTVELDEEVAIYENRFIGTLVHRLINFVEQRRNDISEHFRMQDETSLNVKSEFKYGTSHVEYEMKMLVQVPPEDQEYLVKVKELLEKIDEIRKRLRILQTTPFMRTIDKAKPVRPPIQKTNLLRMQQDYRNCYQLWLYISSYTAVGYSIEIKDKTLPVDGDYFDDLTVLTTLSLKSMVENNLLNKETYEQIEYSAPQVKNYKSMTKYDFQAQFKYDKEASQVEDSINEYYYQQMKRAFSRAASRPVTDDPALQEKELKTSFMRYFNTVTKINNEMYLDLIKKQAPTAVGRTPLQKRQAELAQQNVLIKRLHQLTALKTQDLERSAKMEKRELARAEQIKLAITREQNKIDKAKLAIQKEKERTIKEKERERLKKEKERKAALALKETEKKKKGDAKKAKTAKTPVTVVSDKPTVKREKKVDKIVTKAVQKVEKLTAPEQDVADKLDDALDAMLIALSRGEEDGGAEPIDDEQIDTETTAADEQEDAEEDTKNKARLEEEDCVGSTVMLNEAESNAKPILAERDAEQKQDKLQIDFSVLEQDFEKKIYSPMVDFEKKKP